MSKKYRKIHDHWYDGIKEAVMMYIPGNKIFGTMAARRARIGTLFILPFIIGFIFFMVRPLIFSLQMSLNEVTLKAGGGFEMAWNKFNNYHYAMATDPNFNQYLVTEIGRMGINVIATLVMSFVIAVILNQKFKGRIFCRIIFFLPVILSSGVLPGIESSNEFYNMMSDISISLWPAAFRLSCSSAACSPFLPRSMKRRTWKAAPAGNPSGRSPSPWSARCSWSTASTRSSTSS